MGLVAKHATSPILFAIAANSSGPYVVFNGKRLPERTLTGRHTPPLPPPSPPDNFYGLHALLGGRIVLYPKLVLHFVHQEVRALWITQQMML